MAHIIYDISFFPRIISIPIINMNQETYVDYK